MDYSFDTWKQALTDFQKSVTKDLEEIRQHKEEVQQMKEEIFSAVNAGYFLRDDQRIVISAPEIIIGNVDRDGTLRAGASSHVVLRGQSVDLDGVGEGGQVRTRAASIRQIAADPGSDGQEAVVGALSEVVSQARQVVLQSEHAPGVFTQPPTSAGDGGIRIHAEGSLQVDASNSNSEQKTVIEAILKQLDADKKAAENEAKNHLQSFTELSKAIAKIHDGQEDRLSDVFNIRTTYDDLEALEESFQLLAPQLYNAYNNCSLAIARLAEINRQITCLKEQKDTLSQTADKFKKESTGATLSLVGERIDLVSRDGDGNLRDNEDSGIGLLANAINLQAVDAAGALQEKGSVKIQAQTVEVSTQNDTDVKYEDGKLKEAKYAAKGDFVVKSKNVTFEALDQEFKDDKLEEKALTKESSFCVRTEKMDFSATDTEGKATGSLALNAKDVSLRAMNVEKEKRTDDKLAEGSTLLLLAEKMFLGAKKKDVKSKKVQLATEEMGLFADKTLEAQQGDGKAVLQFSDGKAALSGSETQVYGKTTLNAKTEVKDELKAPKATIEHVEAKTSFKSQNISDGIPVPPPPSTASLSAKLKAEDAPEKK